MWYFLRFLAIFAFLASYTSSAKSETLEAEWTDPNFALCEGLGLHASGRVRAVVTFDNKLAARQISSLSISTDHYHSHSISGTVEWSAPDGKKVTTVLQEPWFEVIRPAGAGRVLFLPRGVGSGPSAQTALHTKLKSVITVRLNLVFGIAGAKCPTSFRQDWYF